MKNNPANLPTSPTITKSTLILVILVGCTHLLLAEEQGIKAFMETEQALKLNAGLQNKLFDLEEKRVLDQQLDLILAIKGSLTPDARNRLEKQGVIIRTVIGTVVTVTAPAEEVPALARFDFIENINLPTRLRLKEDKNEKR